MKLVAASCADISRVEEQPAWAEIQAERPDILLLLGDTVYLARDDHVDARALADELRSLYERQFAQPGFAALLADLRARGGELLAIYDDHDFLGDNRCAEAGEEGLRAAARAEFVRALAPRTTGAEVYGVRRCGPVDVVVLDTRFHRRPPPVSSADPDAILGAAQWRWFEGVVATSRADYLAVASSTTLHRYGDSSWEDFPAAFDRMVALLSRRPGALVIAGDVHRNTAYDESGVIEVVTSGVAQRSARFGALRRNYGVFTFGPEALRVELRSRKVGSRFDFRIPLADWTLP